MRLHHVAYVTKDVEAKAISLARLFRSMEVEPTVVDPAHGVRIKFVKLGDEGLLELLEPLDETSPVQTFLKKGGGLYHLCFEVDDLDRAVQDVLAAGNAVLVHEATEAPAIGGRRVAFVATNERDLFEFVEKAPEENGHG
jgi:methylmalonyl-CoA/ethylmalonyl-CoA epimerase